MAARDSARLDQRLHEVFAFTLLAKGLFALTELISGLALYFVTSDAVAATVQRLTLHEISEDPADLVATALLGFAESFSIEARHFYAFYLASHGAVKLAMVLGLARRIHWVFPAAIGVQFVFITYQIYRYTFAPSWGLISLTLFDLLVVALIWHEYRVFARSAETR